MTIYVGNLYMHSPYLLFLLVLDLQCHLLVLEGQHHLCALLFLCLLLGQEDPLDLVYHLYIDTHLLIVVL